MVSDRLKTTLSEKNKFTFSSTLKRLIKDISDPLAIIVILFAGILVVSAPMVKNLSTESEEEAQEQIVKASTQTTQAFPDVPPSNKYYQAIQELTARSIVNGFPDGKFYPNNPVTRAQFVKMIDLVFNLYPSEQDWNDANPPFNDLVPDDPNNLYPHEYVAVAVRNHITEGIKVGEFGPNNPITRAQIMTMTVRASDNLTPGKLKKSPSFYKNSLGNFSPTHASFAKEFQYNLLGKNVIDGSSWDPMLSITRGETAQILYNVFIYGGETEILFPITVSEATDVQKTAIIQTIKSCFIDYNAILRFYKGARITVKSLDGGWDGQYLGNGNIELNNTSPLPQVREDLEHEMGHLVWELLPPSAWLEWKTLVGSGSNDWYHIPLEHFAESFRIAFFPTHVNFPIKTKLKVISQDEMKTWVMNRLPSSLF
jgi:hypothetical protein